MQGAGVSDDCGLINVLIDETRCGDDHEPFASIGSERHGLSALGLSLTYPPVEGCVALDSFDLEPGEPFAQTEGRGLYVRARFPDSGDATPSEHSGELEFPTTSSPVRYGAHMSRF